MQAEGDLQRARAAYYNVVGQAPGTLTPPELPGNLPKSLDEAVSVAIRDNPNYVAADFTATSTSGSAERSMCFLSSVESKEIDL